MDVDMEMNAESSGQDEDLREHRQNYHPHHQNHRQEQTGNAISDVRDLLGLSRQLLDEGKPSLALQAVLAAIRARGGERAILDALHRARELYQNKMQGTAAADELASLFATCMIHDAKPPPSNGSGFGNGGSSGSAMTVGMAADLAKETSPILAESGRREVIVDAFMDGSSFVCSRCGGLVSNLRKDEHLAYWCGGKR
ncbi:uncharacterized protein LOC144709676 [Wolffia australiana]